MSRTTRSLTCVLWLTLMGIAAAQSDVNDPGLATMQPYSGGVTFGGTNFNIYHLSGNGVGYRNGYTQFGATTPFWLNEDAVFAANGRLSITDTQQIGGSVGAFLRYLDPTRDRIFGVNSYWDIDQSVYDNNYQQIGLGIETLGQWWDFRANGYFVTNDDKNFIGAFGIGNDLTYWQHRVGFLGVGQYENAISGGDWEFGVPLTPVTPWLRGYAGMYYYDAKANTPIGFRGRVEGWVADDLQLGVQVTQDRQFGTNVNASVNFQFAGFRPTRWFPNFTTQDRMLMPVQRNWRVATGKFEQVDFVPAINPRTNQPYFIDWVDNGRLLAGNGTYEHPFNYLPNNSPDADLILVRVGDTTSIAPLSGSIHLQDWQRMLGEGREHEIQAYARYGNLTTPVDTYKLPEFTNTGLYPYLTSNANLVTLASHNEVSAFNMLNANGFAITNTPAGSIDFNTNYLNLRGNGGGIRVQEATGIGLVSHVSALNNTLGGINIDSGDAPLFLSFRDVTSNSVPSGNQLLGIAARADGGAITAQFENVTTNGNTLYGILLTETNSGMQATLDNVSAAGNGIAGLRAEAVGGGMDLSLTDVNTSNNTGRGTWVSGDAGATVTFNYENLTDSGNGGDNIRFTLLNNSQLLGGGLHDAHFDDSVNGSGIVFDIQAARVGTVLNPFDIVDVTASRNGESGLLILADDGARGNFSVKDSRFNGNDLDGTTTIETGGSLVRLHVDPTFLSDNGRDGFHFSVNDGSTLNAVFERDIMAANGRSAIFGNVGLLGGLPSTVNLTIEDTLARNSGADGMRINSANGAVINVEATRASFSNSGQTTPGSSAIRFDAVDSTINLALVNTPLQNVDAFPTGPQEFGLHLNLDNTDFVGTAQDVTVSNNLRNGILANLSNGSTGSLTLTNVTGDGNGADGLKAFVQSGSTFALTATDSSFSNNGLALGAEGSGMNFIALGGSQITANLDTVQVDTNVRHGILGFAGGGSVLGLTTVDSSVDSNGSHGLNVTTVNSQFVADLSTTTFSDNLAGITYYGTGAGPNFSQITMANVTADNNDLHGFLFNVSGGHQLLLDLSDTSFSSNGQYGIQGVVDGAGSVVEINPFLYVVGDNNGAGGLDLHVSHQGFLNANINGGSFSNNGSNGVFDGVHIVVDTAGEAVVCFDGTLANNNTGDGYDFAAYDAGSRLDVALQTSGQYGTLQANNNGGQAVRFFVGPGASGTLFLDGDSEFSGNGASPAVTYSANGAALAAFTFTGSVDGSAGDGLNIQMTNVAQAYIDIHDGSASNNAESGIDISLNNVTFGATPLTVSFIQGDFTANPFRIENMVIEGNGEEGIKIVGTDVIMPVGIIYNNQINNNGQAGAFDGILLDLSGNSILADFSIGNDNVGGSGNEIVANSGNGINVQLHDNSQANLNIQGNTLIGNTLNNVVVNLPDSTVAALHIDNNTIDGDGIPGFQEFQVVQNFTGSVFDLFNDDEPANAMGAVGPNAIVELLNNAFAIYDRNGNQLVSGTDEQFWLSAGADILGNTVLDSRIIYDPTVDRWYAVAITAGVNGLNNDILLAVSNTSDPLDGFNAVSFDGDADGATFSDFDSFGVDRDGLYITTNNYDVRNGTLQNVSIFSIPKSNVTFFPNIANMTRFENEATATRGSSIQPVTNFGTANGGGTLIAADYTVANGRLIQTPVLTSNTPTATLGTSADITGVPPFTTPPFAEQPGGLVTSGNELNSSVVQVGNSIWAVQAVAGTSGNPAVRWYEIDATTGAVLQSGTIQDPTRSYYYPSIAVNTNGDVVIGMNGSGPSQAISSYAVTGTTSAGVTTFDAPLLLQAGSGAYSGNQWGLYSATVVDPNDPNSFWTFQQVAQGSATSATQITQISLVDVPPILGNTTGDGIQVNVRDNATLLDSTINNNIASGHGDNGIHVTLRDNAVANTLNIDGNTASNNGLNGVLVATPAGTPTINTLLSISGPGDMSENGASGINVQLNNVLGTPNVVIDGTKALDGTPARTIGSNGGLGINLVANNTPLNNVTVSNNNVLDNGGRGINLSFLNSTSVNTVTLDANQIDQNGGDGIRLLATNTAIDTVNVTNGSSRGNTGHGLNLDLTNSPITNLNITGNNTGTTVGLGFFVQGSTFGLPFQIVNTSTGNENITGFTFDISTNDFFPGANFDTDSPPVVTVSAASPFTVANGTDLTTGLLTVNGSTSPNFAIPDESQIMTATFNDFNPGEDFQWVVDLDQTPGGDEGYSGDQLIGSTVTVNFSNGDTISGEMTAVPGQPDASTFIASSGVLGAGFSTNTGDGIHFDLTSSNITNILIDNNNINSNGDNGINFAVVNNSDIGSNASPIVISNNNINSNGNDGIRLIDPDTNNKQLNFQLTGNTMDSNIGNGANFQVSNAHNLTLTMTGNTVGTEGNGNLGMGTRVVINDTSTFTGQIGDSNEAANTFTGNRDAGFGLIMNNNATGSLNVVNSSFNGSVDGADTNFAGVGLGVIVHNNASLAQLHVGDANAQNTSFNDNASHGFQLTMSNAATIGGQTQILNVQANGNGEPTVTVADGIHITLTDTATIPDLLVTGTETGSSFSNNTGNGFFISTNSSAVVSNIDMQDVTASGNTLNGLQFVRQGASRIINTTIDGATLTNNTDDGLDITAADNDIADTYTITSSVITGNTGNGVRLFNVGDADLVVSIDDSNISGNTLNGILGTVNADVTDSPTLQLTVTNSTVNDNILNGISIASPHRTTINNNTISGNTQDGINISGSSAFVAFDQIINNDITDNGDDGVDLNGTVLFVNVDSNVISGNTDDGVAMDSNSSGGQQIVFVNNNDILANGGDGVQITARTASGTLVNPNQYFVTNNLIADSGARGINVVNAGGTNGQGGTALQRTVTELTISGNTISRSGLEAIYVINTASNTQANADNVNNLASAALLADGNVFAMPLLNLVVDNNSIDSSGQTQNVGNFIGSTGVVVRVGTSDASTSFTDAGGFANGGRGGVVAAVTDNTFAGNFGSDATFHPFISTVAPATTAGTWTDQNTEPRVPGDDVFTITPFYNSDPLARLDLTFTGNTGNGLLATNNLASTAFYNNIETEFKSRGITTVSTDTDADGAPNFPTAPDDNGPFNSGTRGRNAARQAARGGSFATPTIAAGSTYLFPGVGTSTFRVFGGAAFANSGGAGGNVFTTTFSDFSNSVPIGGDVGELNFVWGSF